MDGLRPPTTSSPGTEELSGHYMVAAPGTLPLGRESDPQLAKLVDELAKGETRFVELTARLSDPSQLHRRPDLPQWVRVRVYVDLATVHIDGNVTSFSGTGYLLVGRSTAGEKYDTEEREVEPFLICAITITVPHDAPAPGTFTGDLTITGGNP